MTATARISATPAAREAIARLRADRGGPVMFVQSAGCCAGSVPMCFPEGEFLVGDGDELLGTVDAVKAQRDRIVAELEALGLHVVPSDANFVSFGDFQDPHAVWQALLDQGVLIREGLLPHKLRVTAGTVEETTAFLDAFTRILRDGGAPLRGKGETQ